MERKQLYIHLYLKKSSVFTALQRNSPKQEHVSLASCFHVGVSTSSAAEGMKAHGRPHGQDAAKQSGYWLTCDSHGQWDLQGSINRGGWECGDVLWYIMAVHLWCFDISHTLINHTGLV